jgi:hypothetical protein
MLPKIETSIDVSAFDEQCYFENYHHYEVYNPAKSYTTDTFEHDYGSGIHHYNYHLYIIKLTQNDSIVKENKYVIAEEVLSLQERQLLVPYCKCYVCTAEWYDIFKYFTCRYDIGCLHTPGYSQRNVNNARTAMSKCT